MIAGLPWTSWLLIASAAGIGLLLVIVFYAARDRGTGDTDPGEQDA